MSTLLLGTNTETIYIDCTIVSCSNLGAGINYILEII